MNLLSKVTGVVACCIALLVMNGGHWLALQTVAWGRMIADFSRENSLAEAIAKTFSGRHPCSLCIKVREGWQQEQQQQKKEPWFKTERLPESFWEQRCVIAPPAPLQAGIEHAFVPVYCSDFIDTPPTPPPRGLA